MLFQEEKAAAKKKEEEKAAAKKKEEEKAAAKMKEEEKAVSKKKEGEKAAAKKKEEEQSAAKKKEEEKAAAKKNDEQMKTVKHKPETGKKDETQTLAGTPNEGRTKTSEVKGIVSNTVNISKGKGLFWATADVYRRDPVEYAIFSMRDFVFFLMFLVLTGLIAFGNLDYRQNYYGNVVSEALTNSKFTTYAGKAKTFAKINDISEIWMYTKAVLTKVLHNAYYATYEEFEGNKVLTESILVGNPRMRQKRVKNDTCQTAELFQGVFRSCYDYYSNDIEDKSDFGSSLNLSSSSWKYTESGEDELPHQASVSVYSAGGYIMNFTSDANLTAQWLQELEDNVWIRLGSRAVFIEFALYSPNANLFCTVKLIFEILPSGGVVSNDEIITSKLWLESNWDWCLLGCKIIFFAYTIFFTLEEITQILILKESYFSNGWNLLDIAIAVMCYIVIFADFQHFRNVLTLNAKVHSVFNPGYSSFDTVSRSLATYKLVIALLTFLVCVKLFKFALLSKTTSFILSTFRTSAEQIMTVTITLFGVISGFAILGTVVLEEVLQFRSFTDSFFTLFGLHVGGLYFLEMNKNVLTTEAKIFLASYIVFVLVIFFSSYVAIVVNGFRKAVFELDDDRTHVYFGDVWNVIMHKVMHFWKDKEKSADDLYRKEANELIKKNFEELLEILRRRGCRGIELSCLLKKHNVRPGMIIPFETLSGLYNDFLARRQLKVEVEGHLLIMDKLERIYNTIDFLDITLGDIWTKMDTLANRITVKKGAQYDNLKDKKKKKW